MKDKEIIPYHKPYPLDAHERELVLERINECLKNGQLTNGKYVEELENRIKELYNVEYCIATSSCTQGLLLCLAFIRPKQLQLTSFNWWSDLYIAQFLEKDICWNDIDIDTWLPNETWAKWYSSLYLNTFGSIGKSKCNDDIIYDSSHCLGVTIREIGLAHVFSLAPTKLITACEGGLIITNEIDLYNIVKNYRDKCSRMSEIHAIIGLQTLKHLDEVKKWKKKVYEYYKSHINGQFQEIPYDSNYNTIGFLNTEKLVIPEHIETRQYYEPLKKGLPNTDYVYENMVCLPSYYGVDYKKIVEDILEYNE